MRPLLACFIMFLVAPFAKANDLRQKYVGRSGCTPELNSSVNDYGIRLDKNQRARLEAHAFKSETILTIVQYSSDADKCGIVRDVIASQHTDSSFVWECLNKRDPLAVVVGTWPAKHPSVSGPAVEAWEIDLKRLRFARLNVPVACDSGNYAGSDESGDLATWVERRAAKQHTNSSPSK
jgi:hypothetical protein